MHSLVYMSLSSTFIQGNSETQSNQGTNSGMWLQSPWTLFYTTHIVISRLIKFFVGSYLEKIRLFFESEKLKAMAETESVAMLILRPLTEIHHLTGKLLKTWSTSSLTSFSKKPGELQFVIKVHVRPLTSSEFHQGGKSLDEKCKGTSLRGEDCGCHKENI